MEWEHFALPDLAQVKAGRGEMTTPHNPSRALFDGCWINALAARTTAPAPDDDGTAEVDRRPVQRRPLQSARFDPISQPLRSHIDGSRRRGGSFLPCIGSNGPALG